MCSPSRLGTLTDKFVFRPSGRALLIACSLLGCLTSFQAPAQTPSPTPANAYPTRPVHIVIPLGPGNSAEVVTRRGAEAVDRIGAAVRHRTPARGSRSDRHRARRSVSGGRLHAPRRNRWRHGGFAEFSRRCAIQPHPRFRADRADGWNPVRLDRAPVGSGRSVHQLIDMAKAEPGKIDYSTGGTAALSSW